MEESGPPIQEMPAMSAMTCSVLVHSCFRNVGLHIYIYMNGLHFGSSWDAVALF